MTKNVFRAAVVTVVLFLTSAATGRAQSSADGRYTGTLRWGTLRVGDIVGHGQRNADDSCTFDQVGVTTPAMKGRVRSLDIQVRDGCQLVVAGKSDVLSPRDDNQPPLLAAEDEVRQKVWMYGYGGTWDVLSALDDVWTFQWDGTHAWVVYYSHYCTAHTSTLWVVDACGVADFNPGGGYQEATYWTTTGYFHFTPFNSYHHWLAGFQGGWPDGYRECTHWFGGSIVAGVTNTCEFF